MWLWLRDDALRRFDRMLICDEQTDGRTPGRSIYRVMYAKRIKTTVNLQWSSSVPTQTAVVE